MSVLNVEARLEDLRFMAETGESATGAARRFGITFNALEMWCRRYRVAEWAILVAREPSVNPASSQSRFQRRRPVHLSEAS